MYPYTLAGMVAISFDKVHQTNVERMDAVNAFMEYRGFGLALQHEVREFYTHLMKSRFVMLKEPEFLADLPSSLRLKVCLHLNQEFIAKVPFLQVRQRRRMLI